jgi:hopanoid biosynthesis associated RND transporter like protein HpnN
MREFPSDPRLAPPTPSDDFEADSALLTTPADHVQEHRSFLSESLASLTAACVRQPRWTLLFMLASAVACGWYTANHLRFKTNRADLIDPSAAFQQRWLEFTRSFGEQNDIVVVVEANSPELIKQVQDEIGGRLKQHPELFTNVLYRIEPGKLREKGLQYLSPQQLAVGLERLKEYQPILDGHWDLISLTTMLPRLRAQLQSKEQKDPAQVPAVLEHIDRLTSSLAAFVENKNAFSNPWPDIIPIDPQMANQKDEVIYILNDEGTLGFVMAAPVVTDDTFLGATAAIDRVRKIIRQTAGEFPEATISLTGIPVLENDEMRRSQSDMNWATIISFVGVAILMLLGFRGMRHPLIGLIMIAVSMTWAFGYTTLVVGHLNILSVAFAAILMGLGVDFAIHTLSRYLELRHEGMSLKAALIETSGTTGVGIITGAVTTSLAFLCAMLTEFLGVAELGIIAGGGIILCAMAAFTILPAMVVVADRAVEPGRLPTPVQGNWLRRLTSRHPWFVVGTCLAASTAIGVAAMDWSSGWPTPKLVYDHNLLNLQAKGLESVAAQTRIFEASQHSLLYAISLADSADEARARKARFAALPTVHRVEELASRLPAHPSSETKLLVQGYHALLARLPSEPPPPKPADHLAVGAELEELYEVLRRRTDPLSQRIAENLDRLLDGYSNLSNFAAQLRFLGEFEYRMSYALLAQFQALEAASNPDPVDVDDLPQELRARFVSPDGHWLLQIFPKDQVWDMEPLEKFVQDVRSVDPDVTGTPLQNYEAARQIKESYEICAVYALLVIVMVLLFDFLDRRHVPWVFLPPLAVVLGIAAALQANNATGYLMPLVAGYTATVFVIAFFLDHSSVWDTCLAIAPPALGLALTLGILGICQVPLNPANLIILPLILGIGVDSGVHVMHDFHAKIHAKPNRVYTLSASTLNAIVLCSSTTMVGFGSMMIAAHQGLYSLGIVLTIGVAACMVVALVALPAVLALLSRRHIADRPQLKIADETRSVAQVA